MFQIHNGTKPKVTFAMIYFAIFWAISVAVEASRGPHHPRGETVVKQHVHYRPTKYSNPEKLTQDEQLLHDASHIQEHLEEILDETDLSKMTEEELEFYYFQVHDSDKNSMLDGLEILQAIHHTSHNFEYAKGEMLDQDEDFPYYVELIDRVLAEDDADHDGFLSYPEYVAGRKKDLQGQMIKNEYPEISALP